MFDSAQQRTSERSHPTPCDHAVQFYEDPAFLQEIVAEFVRDGLRRGEPVLVIATEANRQGFSARLAADGLDVQECIRTGQLRDFDARQTLATVMNGSGPDPALFQRSVGAMIDAARNSFPTATVRAYGEMVDLLWRDGMTVEAIRLEEMWNSLAVTHRFSLLCGYSMGNFYKEAHSEQFREICAQHSRVSPAEHYLQAPDAEGRLREIALLQQRARALEAEIAHRRELEAALRDALAARDRAEAEREHLLTMERAARAEAESAGRVKDHFLAVLSHELRTPLNAILGWAHIANKPGADDGTIRRALEVIQRNASVQVHVTDDLLDLSRILTGKLLVRSERLQLAEVMHAAIETVRPAAAAKSIDLRVVEPSSAVPVLGDRDRLQQVLWNLLTNAIKFTPEHGRVDLQLDVIGPQARVTVQDYGEGIAKEFLPHVFERFRQADTGTTRIHGGLGLGLALVRYLIEAHGGNVTAASDGPGHGSTFVMTLPLAG